MKTKLASKTAFLIIAIIMMTAGALPAQTIAEAGELFNQGKASLTAGDNKAAIEKFNACIDMCRKIDTGEAIILKEQAMGALPSLWYGYAKQLFDNNQVEESIETYKTTLKVAGEYNDVVVLDMTRSVLAQLFLKNGNEKFKNKDFEGAVGDLKNSLVYDSVNTTTLLLMAYSYRRLDNTSEMLRYFKATIDAAGKNDRNAPKASDALLNHYMNTGARMINDKNVADGLKYLDSALVYGESGDLYYYYAVGYYADQRYDDAIAAAEKAIILDPDNKENVAKYYFEIGQAWYAKKDNDKACEAYKLANFGRTALRAEPMIKALKCK